MQKNFCEEEGALFREKTFIFIQEKRKSEILKIKGMWKLRRIKHLRTFYRNLTSSG